MAKSPFPSDQQDKFMLRLSDGMRDRIKAAADANNRSMNSEILATLEEKYPPEVPDVSFATLEKWFRYIEQAPTRDEAVERYNHIKHGLSSTFGVELRLDFPDGKPPQVVICFPSLVPEKLMADGQVVAAREAQEMDDKSWRMIGGRTAGERFPNRPKLK